MAMRPSPVGPIMLSVLRIMVALLFVEHGGIKLLGFPPGSTMPVPHPFSLIWFAGLIELLGGSLIFLGLFTRFAAFLCAGEMAVAYFMVHAPQGFFPVNNMGDSAILYCFVFLYICAAGPGPWSVDAVRMRGRVPQP
jgi:putative oxidoreductase